MASRNIEDHSGLPAKRGEAVEAPPEHRPPSIEVYNEERGPVAVPVVPAGPHTDDRSPTIPRLREHVWPEVHDAFDTESAAVDPRATGDPIGTPDDGKPYPSGR